MRMIRNKTGNSARVAVCLTASIPAICPPVPAVTVRIARTPINPPQKTTAGGSGFLRLFPVVVSEDMVVVNESARVTISAPETFGQQLVPSPPTDRPSTSGMAV